MKKLSLAALVLVATFTSCMNGGSSSPTEQYVILLTSLESRTLDNVYTWDFGYSEIDSLKVKTKYEFRSAPVLREQVITGDTISRIVYSYSKTALTVNVHSNKGVKTDSLKLDSKLMAAELYVNEKPTPYYIHYDSDGYRTQIGDVTMKLGNHTYENAIKDSKDIVSYEYTNVANAMGIQQFGVYGSTYFWPSDRFGRQSRYLLSAVKIVENGAIVTYKFKYDLNENGLVKEETITRDEKPFMSNKYAYKVGIIRR